MTEETVRAATQTSRRNRLIALLLAAAVAVTLAVTTALMFRDRDPARPVALSELVRSGDAAGFNVLFVTLDTVRADRLGCYGDSEAETPAIDSLIKHGVRFDDAVTSVPLTLPAHATMLTGLYPPNHGVRNNGTHYLAPEYTTLAETLKAHGYDTAAFIGCFVLDARFGLNQGFDVYDFRVPADHYRAENPDFNERPANAVTDAAIQWLRQRQRSGATAPFFAWVHYFDAHMPHESPLQEARRFAVRPYDAEIAFVDVQLQRLFRELDKLKLRDRTLVVLVCDHGEALGEHNEDAHGLLLHDCTVRVGFILSSPALFDGPCRVDDRVVGLVDLRATLEDLLGISPVTPSDGISLLAEGPGPDRAVYIETQQPLYWARWSPLYGLRRHSDKYVTAPQPEYYDLRKDPQELRNLHDSNRPDQAELERQLTSLMTEWSSDGRAQKDGTRVMSAEEMERLASLGYIQAETGPPTGDLPDPKDMIPLFNTIAQASRLFDAGQKDEGLALAREAAEQVSGFTLGQRVLADMYVGLDRPEEAAEVLRRSFKQNPDVGTAIVLARVLFELKRHAEAYEFLQAAEALDSRDGRVLMLRGERLVGQQRYAEALELFEKALRLDENRVGVPAREHIQQARRMMRAGRSP